MLCEKIGEDKDNSVVAGVVLKKLAISKQEGHVVKVAESSLPASCHMEKKRLVWEVEGSAGEESKMVRGGPVDPAKPVVELAPMEINAFHRL
ncbi:hypothetical protein NC652_033533 [Populus alba x Populus x berolinensis]|nr:hypothetical protein NC652_033533 [Populus alba x Populus x berolinensis]